VDEQQPVRWWLWATGLALAGIVIGGYLFSWEWTGLPKQDFWDWLKLLIIPAAIAAGTIWFNQQQRDRELKNADSQAEDEALRAYLDQMANLLVAEAQPLGKAKPNDRVAAVVQARTVTLLKMLTRGSRKGSVVQFLYESGLIATEDGPIVRLAGADLHGVQLHMVGIPDPPIKLVQEEKETFPTLARKLAIDLSGADLRRTFLYKAFMLRVDLHGANLSEANLSQATLSNVNLIDANLSDANLNEANLTRTDLSGAKLFGAQVGLTDLSAAKLNGSKLCGAKLYKAKLYSAELKKADFSVANKEFQRQQRSGLTLLSESDLREAILVEADLREVILKDTDLTDADLTGADLTKARVADDQLARCKSLEGASMPDGEVLKGVITPDGPTFEEWRKRKGRREDGENSSSS